MSVLHFLVARIILHEVFYFCYFLNLIEMRVVMEAGEVLPGVILLGSTNNRILALTLQCEGPGLNPRWDLSVPVCTQETPASSLSPKHAIFI